MARFLKLTALSSSEEENNSPGIFNIDHITAIFQKDDFSVVITSECRNHDSYYVKENLSDILPLLCEKKES